jgi:hypothetical protein
LTEKWLKEMQEKKIRRITLLSIASDSEQLTLTRNIKINEILLILIRKNQTFISIQ